MSSMCWLFGPWCEGPAVSVGPDASCAPRIKCCCFCCSCQLLSTQSTCISAVQCCEEPLGAGPVQRAV